MVTQTSYKFIGGADKRSIREYVGLSSDIKPGIGEAINGSTFFEMDTGNMYMYDETNKTWVVI